MKQLMALVVVGVVVGAAAWLAEAQSPTVYVGQTFDVVMTHDGLRTTTYHLAVTGPVAYSADLPVSALVGGRVVFPVPGLSLAGNYSIVVSATGAGGTTPSDPFALDVVVRPAPPAKGVVTIVVH